MNLRALSLFALASAITLIVGCKSLTSLVFTEEPNLRFGVLSDIHVQGFPEGTTYFRKALEWFDQQKVDAVAVSGDLTDYCMLVELDKLSSTWFEVFKDNKRSDGESVVPFMVTGNHDDEGVHYLLGTINGIQGSKVAAAVNGRHKYPMAIGIISNNFAKARRTLKYNLYPEKNKEVLKDIDDFMARVYKAGTNISLIHSFAHESQNIYTNSKALLFENCLTFENITNHWATAFNQSYTSHIHTKVKGYDFIGINWQVIGWRGEVENIKPFFDSLNLPTNKPIFYLQHYHPQYTCHKGQIPQKPGHYDNGSSLAVLTNYPNLIAFSGHTHADISNERTIWQDSFTSIGAGTIRPGSRSKQGLLVSVYDKRIEIERIDFISNEPLGDKWIIPFDKNNQLMRPYNHDYRIATAQPPFFKENDTLKMEIEDPSLLGKGKASLIKLTVPIPQDGKNGGHFNRIDIAYETQGTNGPVLKLATTLRPNLYYRSRKHWGDSIEVNLSPRHLPTRKPFRVVATPISDWGTKGKPLYSEEIKF